MVSGLARDVYRGRRKRTEKESIWPATIHVRNKSPFNRLLVLLVVFDTIFLAADFLTYSLPMLSQQYQDWLNPVRT